MESESHLDITYIVNPNILCSIKSTGTVVVSGTGAPVELPLALFEVLMAFAEKKTARQALQTLDGAVDLERFGTIIREFVDRGLLRRHVPADDEPGLDEFLGHRLLGNPALAPELAVGVPQGRPVIIPDALPMDLAERVHRELDRSNEWVVGEGSHDFFHYRNSIIERLDTRGGALAEAGRLFKSAATRRFIAAFSGRDCSGAAYAAAAWYRPGEYALPHDDATAHASRSVAYIWYLTKDWRQQWGGALFWCATGQYIKPRFNVLVMFNVVPSTLHLVCPVAPSAMAKRLSVNGFWHGVESRQSSGSVPPDAWISPAAYGPPVQQQPDLRPIVVP
jgi:2OG-Fe(II) oxygenase superfamily